MIGRKLQHYLIQNELGRGGMGVVYLAVDTHLDRPVALKILPAETAADPGRKSRFVQETKAASALNHPNIVTVHDISSDAGIDFIVMELGIGKPLDELIPCRKPTAATAPSTASRPRAAKSGSCSPRFLNVPSPSRRQRLVQSCPARPRHRPANQPLLHHQTLEKRPRRQSR